MVTAQRPKPPDKQELCRKVTSLLKKVYHPSAPRHDLPVLESLLYAVCHEDTTPEAAEIAYKRLMTTFPDLNEARVSSITELQAVFHDQEASAWRALRVKSTLQSTFDASYTFELENLKRKTVELAVKHLAKIPTLSWFAQGWALQNALGSHVLPIDARMHAALLWIGLVDHDSDPEQASESLRPYIRKADAPQFCQLIRCLALDPKRSKAYWPPGKSVEPSYNPDEGVHRLEVLLTKGLASVPKPTSVKPPPSAAKLKADAAKAEAARAEAAKIEAAKAAPSKADSHKAAKAEQQAKAEKAKAEQARLAAEKSGDSKSAPSKPVATKPAAGRAVPEKSAPAKSSGAKSPLAKPDPHSKSITSKPGAGKPEVKGDSKRDAKGDGKKRS